MGRSAAQEQLKDIKVKVTYDATKYAPTVAIPEGSADEIIAWGRTSELRAKRALAREIAAPKPRLKVIIGLSEILGIDIGE